MNAVRAHIPMVEVIRQIYPRIYWDEGFAVYDFLGTDVGFGNDRPDVDELPWEVI